MSRGRRLALVGRPSAPDELLAQLKEMEELLQFPGVPGHVARAAQLAIGIARAASGGGIPSLAMRVISEANALREAALGLRPDRGNLNAALWRLRLALQQARSAGGRRH